MPGIMFSAMLRAADRGGLQGVPFGRRRSNSIRRELDNEFAEQRR